ncbi:MAG: glycosyltransferase family 39 protein [Candidatus Scalindua sediminis]|nr:glycosyltransferase family 39 protein [Candidatus Scalindua sediminis]
MLLNDKYVWILLFISLSVRIYLGIFTYVIQNDSVAFMQNAEYFANGDFLNGLRHDYHPLYSLIMAGLYKIVPNMELSGTIISIFFGTLTVIAFYLIGKGIFDQRIAFVSSVILAFHPYAVRFSADIISESTYFFFFTSALGLGFFAITSGRLLLFALTGICTAFAYLTRPEGIGILFIVICWCLLKDFVRIKIVWKEKLVSILVLVISFLALSSPYLISIKKETGAWHLTKKKNVSEIVGVKKMLSGPANEPAKHQVRNNIPPFPSHRAPNRPHPGEQSNSGLKSSHGQAQDKDKGIVKRSNAGITKQTISNDINLRTHLESVLYIAKKYLSTFHPFLFIFLIIGVINWTRIKRERLFGLYITTIIIFYLFIMYRLNITQMAYFGDIFQYPSRRHLMPLVIPAVFCVGIGVCATGTWMRERFQIDRLRFGFKEVLRNVWIVQLIILVIVVGALLPKTLKPQGIGKLGVKKAGQWLRENSDKPSPAILSASARNAYYAGGRHIQMGSVSNALSRARAKKADYILITHKEYKAMGEKLQQSIGNKQIMLIYKYPEENSLNKHRIFLYKVIY